MPPRCGEGFAFIFRTRVGESVIFEVWACNPRGEG